MQEDRFFILMCPNCGHMQVKEVRDIHKAVFKCFKCNKTRKIKSKKKFGLQIRSFGNFDCRTATVKLQGIKAKEGNA